MPVKKILRIIGWSALALVLAAAGFFGWLMYDFHQSTKADFWSTDAPPDALMRSRLADRGLPPTISRVVSHGVASRFNGDGEDLTIYCFPPAELPLMKQVLGSQGVWVDGLPGDGGWKLYLRDHAPQDLRIDDASDGRDYIHIRPDEGYFGRTIIDIRRGISYDYRLRT